MTKVREKHGPKTAESPIKTSGSQLAENYCIQTCDIFRMRELYVGQTIHGRIGICRMSTSRNVHWGLKKGDFLSTVSNFIRAIFIR